MLIRRVLGTAAIATSLAVCSAVGGTAMASPGRFEAGPALAAGVATSGVNLSGWKMVLGDAIATFDGAPVTASDIARSDGSKGTKLRANVAQRAVMAHALAYTPRQSAVTSTQDAAYTFRLPSTPTATSTYRGQTAEGGLFFWDGAGTRLDYGVAWQWIVNPAAANFGRLRVWDGSGWVDSGVYVRPDSNAHRVVMHIAPSSGVGTVTFDGKMIGSSLSVAAKPSWGVDQTARLQAESVSVWPGSNVAQPEHQVTFSNWSWTTS